jgi:hypothetical protein
MVIGAEGSSQAAIILNYDSGELTYTQSLGAAMTSGVPNVVCAGASGGLLFPFNYSSNDLLPAVDPASGLRPFIVNVGLAGGVCALPTGGDFAFKEGGSYTPVAVTLELLPWNWPQDGIVHRDLDYRPLLMLEDALRKALGGNPPAQ